MIVVMTKFPIKKEYFKDFEERAKSQFGEKGLTKQEGFIKMNILKPMLIPPNPENNLFIIETYWKDLESFKKYTESPAFAEAHKNPPPQEWFTGRPTVDVFEVIKEKS
ncbi:antibiotic biosynthesis monooxygenase family protein [Hydrogenothermus marinus]|uniref:Heme-degrading monooxygenase HmoA n=1 Tax=Hydrogenothermus marinus TaxID=133270 RepID=A0A3M0B9G1_9AQUI|nr:antibiotic biosynthesis monooxygenase [Hydrogenothermus marinus]RMA93226.1 heme-degrading monooxygenase HmoA [Hydrogenothermus marinus]